MKFLFSQVVYFKKTTADQPSPFPFGRLLLPTGTCHKAPAKLLVSNKSELRNELASFSGKSFERMDAIYKAMI